MKHLKSSLLWGMVAVTTMAGQTGTPVPELAALDRFLVQLQTKWELPGVSLALTKGGRLVYARGAGLADANANRPVTPETLFRIGSIAKPLTAVTVLHLAEEGRLRLDAPVFDILTELRPLVKDARMLSITVRQLLQHTAGWDDAVTPSPLFAGHAEIAAAGASFPPAKQEIAAYLLSQPLDRAPGAQQGYSNSGYFLAGRLIEKVSGLPYEEAVRRLVLEPQGITRMRIGRSLEDQAAPGEARYRARNPELAASIFSREVRMAPLPYGRYSFDLLDAAGGWIGSPTDLVRLMTAIDGSRANLLGHEWFAELVRPPAGVAATGVYYALGMMAERAGDRYNLLHNGGIEGTYSLFASIPGLGITFALLTNTDNEDEAFEREILMGIGQALLAVSRWPEGDQFRAMPYQGAIPRIGQPVNAASYERTALSGGMLATVFGEHLEEAAIWVDATPAVVLARTAGQVNFIVPGDAAGKNGVALTAERRGRWSGTVLAGVTRAAPGLFTLSAAGTGPAAALNADGRLNSAAEPAAGGSRVTLFATGTGDGTAPMRVLVAEREVAPRAVWATPELPVTLVEFEVPGGLAARGEIPIAIRVGESRSRAGVTLWVR